MKKIFLILLIFVSSWTFAQQNIVPSVNIKNDPLQFLKLDKLDITVQIVGNIATTTLEMSFYNSTNRILEGELNFPLGEGQTVSRFAMDVNGKLREGVVVEKEKGTEVFEAVIRRKVDPGLLEMTKGNNFKARVYPIPANGFKKMVVAYEHELLSENNHYQFNLPLSLNDKLTNFDVHIRVYGQSAIPVVAKGESINLKFEKQQEDFVADISKKNYQPASQLAFLLPIEMNNRLAFTYKGLVDSVSYFYLNLHPQKQNKEKPKPKKMALYYDISGSSKMRNIKKEMDLLDFYFKWADNIEVQLIPFSNTVNKTQTFKISSGNWTELKFALNKLKPDGATQLGALDFNQSNCDEILLLSDGLSNFGKDRILLSQTPVVVINSNTISDHSYLNFIAQSTAGIYLNLNDIGNKDAQDLMTHVNLRFLSAEYPSGMIYDFLPSLPTKVGNSFSVVGKIKNNEGRIKLNFGYGKTIAYTEECQINNNHAVVNNLIERIWVQKKIND